MEIAVPGKCFNCCFANDISITTFMPTIVLDHVFANFANCCSAFGWTGGQGARDDHGAVVSLDDMQS